MRPLNEVGLRAKLLLAFGLLVAAILAVGLVALNRVKLINAALQRVSSRLSKVELARTALRYSALNSRITMEIFLLDDPRAIKALLTERASNTATISELHTELSQLLDTFEERKLLGEIRAAREPYVKSYLKALDLLLEIKDRKHARQVMIDETLPLIGEYHAAVEGFLEFEADQMTRESTLASKQVIAARSTLVILLCATVLVALGIGAITTTLILGEMRGRRLGEEQLRSSRDSLEKQVAERTAELAKTNQNLKEEIAERLRAEEALRQREADLNEAQRVAHVGSWDWVPESDNVLWSEELFHIAGRDPGTKPPGFRMQSQLYTPESWERLRESVERTARTGEPYEIELELVRPDGTNRWIIATGEARRDPAGRIVGMRGTAQDITERRRLEEQFRQSQKMEAVGRLAGGIAHDFNNLLTAILGYSELMEARLPEDEDLRSSLREIHHAGERAAALTRQLLAFSRKLVLQPRLLDLNAVVLEVEKLLRRLIGEDVELVTRLDPALGSIKADPGQLEQVLMNLSVNGRDAMPEGGTLTIETANALLDARFVAGHPGARPGEYAALTVADTGIGMSDEVRSHAFEPFFTTKEQGKGTGLGLATAYGIVKQSDGYITVESEPGRGTTFRIYLPRTAGAAEASGLGERPALSPGGTETILLVEDESGVRRLSRTILEAQGYTVLEAASGEKALEIARSHAGKIHLIATDVIMPGINGRVLWDRLQVLRPDARILFMSGYTDDTIARHRVLERGIAFLQKPFTPHGLAEKVRGVLDAAPGAGT